METLEEQYAAFSRNILSACEKSFKKSSGKIVPHLSKPWWNDKCYEAVKARHKARNFFRKRPNTDNLLLMRKAEALVKREVKHAKRLSFQTFCSEINDRTTTKTVWNFIGKLTNKRAARKKIPIKHNNLIYTDPTDKANLFATHYEKIFCNISHTLNSDDLMETIIRGITDTTCEDYNSPFTMHELEKSLSSLKGTAPGGDTIHNNMLKILPYSYCECMLEMINDSYNNAEIPSSWKIATILPFSKPEKKIDLVTSHRPISLLNCFPKLMSKLVNRRLNFALERNNAYSPSQCGFRRRLGTLDQLTRYEQHIRVALKTKQICVSVFFDISAAYDSVWHTGLLYKLAKSGIKGKMLAWIQNFLKDRKFQVYFEGEYSEEKKIISGVPQGSILSPTLFNIMISDIPRVEGVTLSEYADDLLIYAADTDKTKVGNMIQKQIDCLFRWTEEWGFTLNPQKTKAMLHTARFIAAPMLNINGNKIEYVQAHKYLGMIIDGPELTWKRHIESLHNKCISKVNCIKVMSSHKWGQIEQC